ncbi:putative acyl-activating enzyme 19 isoform X1 [Salvia splendens]|uniref:putative acyl-activating enzyme 19 isoform X1 n=2 Tax=Salvia splendens TaxID=180675 RepID=UPI001C26AAA5|nr:putative acyl-activating enzyme 19 isoform X1 [Salvia splendens]
MSCAGAADCRRSPCCISHEFYKAASKSPNKVAVIHASSIARDSAQPAANSTKFASAESRPPLYDGDEHFTFSDILSAVENLSLRLRRFLDGTTKPSLIKPRSVNVASDKSVHISEYLESSSQSVQQPTKTRNMHIPKVVGIYMEPSVEYIVAVLSILRCGEAFMPLDPSWPKERILSLLSYSKADLVIGTDKSIEGNSCHRLDSSKWLVDEGRIPVLFYSVKEIINRQSHLILGWPCENESLRSFCYLMYTSGSTGKPKGVCGTEIGLDHLFCSPTPVLSWQNEITVGLLNRFLWMQDMYPLHEGDVVLFKTSISFIDHMQEFLGSILSTCTLVIPPFSQLKENVFCIIDFLQGYFISRFVAVPSLMRTILPSLRGPLLAAIQDSLKLLVLSGEVLNIPLYNMLLKSLPKTSILNLYGSTEVTGDCTYFDCKRLSLLLETEVLTSVPIGLPMSNCDVVLHGENNPHEGEIFVGGLCVAAGYFNHPYLKPLADGTLSSEHDANGCKVQHYYKTGDFARKLPSGDLVCLGRKDRIVKVSGHRIALEEIESALRDHPDVADAAVLSREVDGEFLLLEAHVVMDKTAEHDKLLKTALKNWLLGKLPRIMIPVNIMLTKSLPLTSSGKVDFLSLANSTLPDQQSRIDIGEISQDHLIQVIRKAFSEVLMVEKVSADDNFFVMGGNSISAAYVSFKLGIHMKFLYTFPTPSMLQMALLSPSSHLETYTDLEVDSRRPEGRILSRESSISSTLLDKANKMLIQADTDGGIYNPTKKSKTESNACYSEKQSPANSLWNPTAVQTECSFSRCNKSEHGRQCDRSYLCNSIGPNIVPRDGKGFMRELWKVDMGSCVDASPLVVSSGSNIYLFIGSHSNKFVCIDGRSGIVQWETRLDGRVECSAAIVDELSQIVVGCYQGNIYFLHFSNGNVKWSFRTNGEVKSQPVVDKCRHLVWCGSYDHSLYAIDYKSYCCIYKLPCGGSIFGSPAINEMQQMLYVASTNGHVTALEIKNLPFKKLWKQDVGAPVFGSLSINSSDGNIICCLVDGTVVVLRTCGSIVWKVSTGGPIFAGPCASQALPSQVLICSRDGCIYSFEMETGNLIWKHTLGRPITSSPYVDENTQLMSNNSSSSDRLICVCDSSGSIFVLRVDSDMNKVEEFARLDLEGDIFSSPVMIGGRIFVGCRDDYVRCIKLDIK